MSSAATTGVSSSGNIVTRPMLGIAGVLLGASIATGLGRLLSVGLSDLRGAMHFSADEASWLSTAFNAAMMFIGPFSVYLGGLLGARRVLLTCAAIFTVLTLLMPFAGNVTTLVALLILAGLTAGTFYPLTLSFLLRNLPTRLVLVGIGAYAFDILFTTSFAVSLEAWFVEHLSWRWIFWNSSILTPLMMIFIYFGIPPQPLPKADPDHPKPNWRGFCYASFGFSLLFIALDQGQRLDWLHSGTIVGLILASGFLLLGALIRRLRMPNPLINFPFLARRNTLLLSGVLFCFRFVLLATVIAIPNYLGAVQGYRALQTGPVLLWVAVPQLILGFLAIYSLKHVDVRAVLTLGFSLVAIACWMNYQLSPAWSGENFWLPQLVLSLGLALSFNSMVGAIILEVINTGALSRPIDVLTFSGYFQTVRLLGGEIGVATLLHWIPLREQFHSNLLGQYVAVGQNATDQRLLQLSLGMLSRSTDITEASNRAGILLGLQIRKQAFTLAICDSFLLLAWAAIFCLLLVALMSRVPTQYREITNQVPPAA